jgi:hypothetical protein
LEHHATLISPGGQSDASNFNLTRFISKRAEHKVSLYLPAKPTTEGYLTESEIYAIIPNEQLDSLGKQYRIDEWKYSREYRF